MLTVQGSYDRPPLWYPKAPSSPSDDRSVAITLRRDAKNEEINQWLVSEEQLDLQETEIQFPVKLSTSRFTEVSFTSKKQVKEIQIHAYDKVTLLLEGGRKVAVAPHFLDLPKVNNEKLAKYLTYTHFVVSELSHGSYKLTASLRLKGGGSVPSKPQKQVQPLSHQPPTSNNAILNSLQNNAISTAAVASKTASSATPQEQFTVDNVPTTKALAEQLKRTKKKSPGDHSYDDPMQALALAVIGLFEQTPTSVKTKSLIEEVTALAYANNEEVTRSLLKALLKEINHGELIDINLLNSLRTTLVHGSITVLNGGNLPHSNNLSPDDLIKVLKIPMELITQLHRQDGASNELNAALSAICDILDVMVDAKVTHVKRVETHEPLYNILDTLSSDKDFLVSAQASYAKQALRRIPNDESSIKSFFRHGFAFLQGVSYIYQAVSGLDPSKLLDAIKTFKESIDFSKLKDGYNELKEAGFFEELKKMWYEDIRILKFLNYKTHRDIYSKIIEERKEKFKDTAKTYFIGNVLGILRDIIHNDSDFDSRKWALDRMKDLFLDDDTWGSDKDVKQYILIQLRNCAALPDEATFIYAMTVLADLENNNSLTDDKKRLIKAVLLSLPIVLSNGDHHVEAPSTTLITNARHTNVLSLKQKIEQMRERTLNNKDVKKDLDLYVDLNGSRYLFDPSKESVSLNKITKEFLDGDQKVFLLLGDSGGGKTSFLRYVENELWKRWPSNKRIPLFISLPTLKLPFNEAISEALYEKGFTAAEQKDLKNQYSFIFLLDGYDELKQKKNLFIGNKLNEWENSKTIITCRTQYLAGEEASYPNYFSPDPVNYSYASFDVASTSPFSLDEVEAYCKKNIDSKKIPLSWSDFKNIILSPDLSEIIKNPFLLRVIVDVLSDIIQANQQSQALEKLEFHIDIFDAFIKNWFNREEKRLIGTDKEINISDLKDFFTTFAENLALEMVKEGIVSVNYNESSDLFNEVPSKWGKFFCSDPKISYIRSGVPLRKNGSYSYAFIHKSLLEYFCARAIIKNDIASFDNMNKMILSNEPEIIRLLAECVTKSPSLKNQLFKFIELSKPNIPPTDEYPKTGSKAAIAAANAITVLNAARVNLSGKDFEGVHIANAVLSNALLTRTNLSKADLRNVKLNDAILDYSTIAGCNADGLELGQKPFIKVPGIECFGMSHDGKRALTVTSHHVCPFDLETGKVLAPLFKCKRSGVDSIALSNDGIWAVTQGLNCAQLWNCENREESYSFPHDDNVTSVALTPDGKKALSGSEDKTVRLWDCQTGEEIHIFRGHIREINSVALSTDGKRALSGSSDNSVRLWDCQTGEQIKILEMLHRDVVSSVAFSPDGKRVLSGSWDKSVRLWDCQTGEMIKTFEGHEGNVNSVAFSPDGKWVLSGSDDTTVRLWDCVTGDLLTTFPGHNGGVYKVAFSPDGKWAYSDGADGVIRSWDLNRSKIHNSKAMSPAIHNFIIPPDGKWAHFRSKDSFVQLYNCETGETHRTLLKPNEEDLAFSAEGVLALLRSKNGSVNLWDCNTGQKLPSLDHGIVFCTALSPDGKWALSGGLDKTVHLWDCATGKKVTTFQHDGTVSTVAFSSKGNWAITGSSDGTARLWDCINRKELKKFEHDGRVNIVTFSPNGNLVLSCCGSAISLWNCQDGVKLYSFEKHTHSVSSLAFSANGNWALSGSNDKTVRIWNCNKIEDYCLPLEASITGIRSSPDERSILVSTLNNVQSWEVFDEHGNFKPVLNWNIGATSLSAQDLDMEKVQNLSETNRILLEQLWWLDIMSILQFIL